MSIREGMEASRGDWRVLLAMNLVLSFFMGYTIVVGLALLDVLTFAWPTVGAATLLLVALTYAITH